MYFELQKNHNRIKSADNRYQAFYLNRVLCNIYEIAYIMEVSNRLIGSVKA